MSSKFDDRSVRMECLRLANALAISCKVDRSSMVTDLAAKFYRFIVDGEDGQALITLPEGMSAAEANNIIESFARPRRKLEVVE